MKLEVNTEQLDELLHRLEKLRRSAVPYAIRDSLNASAWQAKREWGNEMDKKLTIRNTWTKRGIRTERARGTAIHRMESRVGSVREYMSRLEEGGVISDTRGVPIHTSVASGEGRGTRPRTKVVRPANRLNAIQRHKGIKGNRSQKNWGAVQLALKSGAKNKVAYMEVGARKGLYKVSGSKKNPQIDLLIDLTQTSHRVRARPTLLPTIVALQPKLRTLHALAIIRQLRRQGWR